MTPDSNERPCPRGPGARFALGLLAVLGQELHHVIEPEAAITALADSIERHLAAIAASLDRVDMQVKHVGDFGRGEHGSQFVDGHRCHLRLPRAVPFSIGPGPWGAPRWTPAPCAAGRRGGGWPAPSLPLDERRGPPG